MRRWFILLWRVGRTDLRLLAYALRHPARPVWLIPCMIALAIYAIQPLNFALPLLGAVDDLVLLPLLAHILLKALPAEIRRSFGATAGSSRPR
jgi:uncharacterized membrane protein YkvA (DUF1232 family)